MNLEEKLSQVEKIGQNHIGTSTDTPLREDAFDINDEQKIKTVQEHVEGIIHTLDIELSDDSLKGTPLRVAKMYVKEIFAGLNNKHKPKMFTFDNKYKYGEMLVEKILLCTRHANITCYSSLEKLTWLIFRLGVLSDFLKRTA